MFTIVGEYVENIKEGAELFPSSYATIEVVNLANGIFKWKNRDNQEWTLTQNPSSPTLFDVG